MANVEASTRNLNDLLEQFVAFSEALNSGEGTLGKLVHDDDIYQQIQRVVGNAEEITRAGPTDRGRRPHLYRQDRPRPAATGRQRRPGPPPQRSEDGPERMVAGLFLPHRDMRPASSGIFRPQVTLLHLEAYLGLLINGCVGDGAGPEFAAFLETQALPDPEDVLADPQILRLPRSGDLAVAIVRSILPRVETHNSIDRWERCCDVFEHTYRQNKEVAMAGHGRLWKLKPAAYAPPKRNGVFAEMDTLRNR